MELWGFLAWLVKYGAGAIAYVLVDRVPRLVALPPTTKRIAAAAIAGAIAIIGYLLQLTMLYEPAPVGVRPWAEMLFLVATSAFGLATIIHAKDLEREKRMV